MNVTTAVIFAAGFGSRMLPVTAAVQKELIPILERPVIDYVVSDCVAAGITRIIFVVRPGSHGLQDYYLGNIGLQQHLERYQKHKELDTLSAVHRQATFEFIEQPADGRYGTAIPILAAMPHIPDTEAFLVCGGDDFLWHADGSSEIKALIETFQTNHAIGALMALQRPTADLSRYGVLQVVSRNGGEYLSDFVEKPAPGTAPSDLINISKYIFTPTLLNYVREVTPNPASGEYYVTDAIQKAAQDHPIAVHRATGRFLDAGNVTGWLEANLVISQAHPDLSNFVKHFKI